MGGYKLRDKERSKESAYVSYRFFQNTPQTKVLTFPAGFFRAPLKAKDEILDTCLPRLTLCSCTLPATTFVF